ncbi:GroES (chaperonin 10)-like protein [Rhypophila sp. PSN 637]
MAPPKTQKALIQTPKPGSGSGSSAKDGGSGSGGLPLSISPAPVPTLPSPNHVLIRVRAVALNPNDHKMLDNFPVPGNGAGCDFCGVVEELGSSVDSAVFLPGKTRVCGAVFPYSANLAPEEAHRGIGAFAEWIVADSRLLLRVPEAWSDLQGAALGGVGWSTLGLAISHPDALGLSGLPSSPAPVVEASGKTRPVLVYGGGTATGTMACQLLKFSGYSPVAVVYSDTSAALAMKYGAEVIKKLNREKQIASQATESPLTDEPIRYVIDCITDADSASFCFAAVTRTGGRYACLERFRDAWKTRRIVKVKEVMGYETLGDTVDIGGSNSVYTRPANESAFEVGMHWREEMQRLLDRGMVEPHPIREVTEGKGGAVGWDGVVAGLLELKTGRVRGRKLVVRIS